MNKLLTYQQLKQEDINGDCTRLVVLPYSSERLNIFWTNNSTNEDGVSVERSQDCINFQVVNTLVKDSIGYAGARLEPDTLYFYRVRAFKGKRYSKYSNIGEGRTNALKPIIEEIEETKPFVPKKKTLFTFVSDLVRKVIKIFIKWANTIVSKKKK